MVLKSLTWCKFKVVERFPYAISEYTDPTLIWRLKSTCFSLSSSFDSFMLWQNDNAIIIGKHQNTAEEINASFVKEHDIRAARRLSGGGRVYHDMGNLNFTFITAQCRPGDVGLPSARINRMINPVLIFRFFASHHRCSRQPGVKPNYPAQRHDDRWQKFSGMRNTPKGRDASWDATFDSDLRCTQALNVSRNK